MGWLAGRPPYTLGFQSQKHAKHTKMTKTNEIGNKKHKNPRNLQIHSKIVFFRKINQKPTEIY